MTALTTDSELNGCLLARFDGPVVPDWLRDWLDAGLAGVLLFAGNVTNPAQLTALTAELRARNPGLLIAMDEEGGIVTRLEAATGSSYPGNAALGAIGDPGLTRQIGLDIGARLAGHGINLNLAPVADLDASTASPVIGVRSFGGDPALVASHTAAFIDGLQASMVAACAKHFPGHGRAAADSHLELPSVPATLAELRDTDLVPFRAAIAAGVRSIMSAHVVFPAIDDVPATLSHRLLHDVLRGELGFGGVIVTDALGMAAIGDDEQSATGAVRALAAGADLLCLPQGEAAQRTARAALAAAVSSGAVSRPRVAQAAERVRALAAWARPSAAAAPDPSLGPAAARRGLLIDGPVGPLTAAPYLLDAGGRMSAQLADSAASLLGVLQATLPGTDGIRLTGPADATPAAVNRALAAAAGRPLVVAVRDAHRQDWQRNLLEQVLAERPDTIVTGTGTIHDRPLAGPAYLGTRGSSRASLTAAARLLAGKDGGFAADEC